MLRNVRDILNENAVGFKLTAWNSVRMCVEYAMKPHNLIYMDGGFNRRRLIFLIIIYSLPFYLRNKKK